MAELILKVGTVDYGSPYTDGDLLEAFNDRRIGHVHIGHICDVRKFGFTGDGLRPDSLGREHREMISQYKFQRISSTEVSREALATGDREIFSATPNAKGKAMDVALFVKRRLKHHSHLIFGTPGAEYWYGGYPDASATKVSEVWGMIEGNTALRRADHIKLPDFNTQGFQFASLTTVDFVDADADIMMAPFLYNDNVSLGKRVCSVPYSELDEIAGPIKNKIANKQVHIDVRDYARFIPEDIVEMKI